MKLSCKLKNQRYDAIVSDYEMPVKNGLDFLTELRKEKNNIAFIVFTGRGKKKLRASIKPGRTTTSTRRALPKWFLANWECDREDWKARRKQFGS